MKYVALCIAGAILVPRGDGRAQQPPPRAPEWAVERLTRERWMHAAQQPRFTPFAEDRSFLAIDSIRLDGDARRVHITLGRTAFGRDSAVITSDDRGRVRSMNAGFAPVKRREGETSQDSVRMEEFFRMSDGRLSIAGPRVWDVVVPFPATPRQGERWTDTIAYVASDSPYVQTMSGVRDSRIVGDTSIAGQRLWIVRDSAFVTLDLRHPERERTLEREAQVSRTVRGVVRGTYLYDPAVQLAWQRTDTAMLSGEAVLRYADGRVFRTPARYERFRAWQLHDSAQYQTRRAALNRESADRRGGMVRVPASELERRLSQNDSVLRDSLLLAMTRTRDAEELNRIVRMVQLWGRLNGDARRRFDSIRVATGDSAHLYRSLADVAYSRAPFNAADARAMIPYMEDPGKAWALNVSRDWLYENLVQGMTTWPLAAPGYGGRTSCTPDGCRVLAALWPSAREPRLRDVALVALFSADPATWADTVLRVAGSGRPLLKSSVTLADGVGANWPAAAKLPMPSPNSDWRRWLLWMDGRTPEFTQRAVANSARFGWALDTAPKARFEESHRTAIRMHMVRTNRDIVSELRRAYDQASNDTAFLVFGTLLQGLDALRLSEGQLAEAFTSGSPGRSGAARRALTQTFTSNASPMPDSLAAPLVDRLLRIVLDTAAIWRNVTPDVPPQGRRSSPELHARRGRVRLSAENLPAAVREQWASRTEIVPAGGLRNADLREHAVMYTLRPVVRYGRFVRLTLNASEQMARAANQSPVLYASGTTYYLMQLGDEWVIVAMESWVT